jgi:TDG/mug DNA glycosylase family protein
MTVLPNVLAPELKVVFCGTAVATASAQRGHYYSGRGNRLWQLLHDSGLTPTQLDPEEDSRLPTFGIGITDLVKDVAQSHDRGLDYSGTTTVAADIEAAAPIWVGFNGMTAGKNAARQLGHRTTELGIQDWTIGNSQVIVLPSSSGAHASMPYAEKLQWWTQLADLAKVVD